ncbi:alpha/beta hydrolase [Paractinoplanes durhamensis]|uniref:Alpha/beta hydrolase n=1 Tax=Paractinoplanes durhamensis TaxID=113563 RepID=A0ABQ3Z3S0_9ACTN|nr:alpha/beta fold hydrolase [Actinoplanes durhamensis]GIE04473.1 alpha/beta hydrolase [Actinoplanes durhamensis]
MSHDLLRFDDWTSPVPPVEREVLSRLVEGEDEHEHPPLLFVTGPGVGAWAFAEHWLAHTAGRGFPAHALTPREGGDLRAHVHDVVQTAASLPRQAVLIGHGVGALVVSRALGRYPARAAVLVAPAMDRWATFGAAIKTNPLGTLRGRPRLNRKQLFSASLPAEEADAYLARMTFAHRLAFPKQVPSPVGKPPVLVVGSPDDRVVPRKSLDRVAAHYGGAPLLFPGMGHALMLDAGWAEPIDATLDWLTKELTAAS